MIAELMVLAMMGGPAAQGGGAGGLSSMMVPMMIILGIMYFMMIRPQQRRDKERREMIENVKSGDKIMFSGGILGTVTNVKEATFTVKVADNVKIEVARGAISKVLDKGEKISKDDEVA